MLAVAGGIAVLVALAWSGVLPFNKKLWTPSYALVSSGIAALLLAALTWLLDLRGWRRGTRVFELLGRNTLAVYLFSEIGNRTLWTIDSGERALALRDPGGDTSLMVWLYYHAFEPFAGMHNGALLESLAWLAICCLPAWWLDRKRIYLRA
jgi:predicted acyltransferase